MPFFPTVSRALGLVADDTGPMARSRVV